MGISEYGRFPQEPSLFSMLSLLHQTGEYYNKERNIMDDVARFRKSAYTKDLMNSVGMSALKYCSQDTWNPCQSDNNTFDKAGIV